jgi:hypothetical protein
MDLRSISRQGGSIQATDEYIDYNTLRIEYVKKIFRSNKIVYIISVGVLETFHYRYPKSYFVRTVDIVLNSNCSDLTLSMSNEYRYGSRVTSYEMLYDSMETGIGGRTTREQRLNSLKMSNYTYSNNLSSKIPDYYTYLSRCDAFNINNSNYIQAAVSNSFSILSSNLINRNPRSNGNDIMIRIGYTKADIFLSKLYYVVELHTRPYEWVNYYGNIIKGYSDGHLNSVKRKLDEGEDASLVPILGYLDRKSYYEFTVNLDINFETCTLNNYSYNFNPRDITYTNDTNRFHFQPRGIRPFNTWLLDIGYTLNSNISNEMSYTDNTSNILRPSMRLEEKFNICFSNPLNAEMLSYYLGTDRVPSPDATIDFGSGVIGRGLTIQNLYYYKKQDGDIRGESSTLPRFYCIFSAITNVPAEPPPSLRRKTLEFNMEIERRIFINVLTVQREYNARRSGSNIIDSFNVFNIANSSCSDLFLYQDYNSRNILNENIREYALSNNYIQYSQGGLYRINQAALMNSCRTIDLNIILNSYGDALGIYSFKNISLSNMDLYNKALYTKKDFSNLTLSAIAESYQIGSSNVFFTEIKYDIFDIQSNCSYNNTRPSIKIISTSNLNTSNLNTYALSNGFIPFNNGLFVFEGVTRIRMLDGVNTVSIRSFLNQKVIIRDNSDENKNENDQFRSLEWLEPWGTRIASELNDYLPTSSSLNYENDRQRIFGSNIGNIVNRYITNIITMDDDGAYVSCIAYLDDKDDIYYLVHKIRVIDMPYAFVNITEMKIHKYSYPTDYDTFLSFEPNTIFKQARMRKCNINPLNSSLLSRINDLITYTDFRNIITTNNLPYPNSLSVMPAYFKLYSDTANDQVGYKYLLALRVNTNVEYYSEVSLEIVGNFANCFDFVVLQPPPTDSLLTYNNGLIYTNITISNYISSNNYTRLSTYNPIQQLPTSGGNQLTCEIQNIFDTSIRPNINDFSVLPRFLPPPFYIASYQIYNVVNSNYRFNANQNVTFYNTSGEVTQPLSNIIRNYTTLIDNEYNLVVYDSNIGMTNNLINLVTDERIKYTGNYVSIDIYASQSSLFLTMYKKVTTSNLTNSYILRTVTNVNVISNGNLISNYNSNIFTLVRLKYNSGINNCFSEATPFYDDPIEYIPLSVPNIANYAVSNGFSITPEYEFYLTNNSPIERFTNKVDTSEKYYKYVCLESKKEFKIEDFKLYGIGEGLIETDLIKQESNKIIYEIRIPQEITSYTFRTNSFSPNYDPIRWELKGSTGKDWKVISRKSLEKEQPRNYQLPLIYLDGRIKTLSQPVSKITDKPPPRIEEKVLDKETLVKYYKQKINSSIKPEFKKYMRDNDTYYCLFDAYDLNRNMVGKDLIVGFIMRDGRVKKPVLYEDDEGNYVPFDMRKKTIKEFWDRTIMLPLLFSTSF